MEVSTRPARPVTYLRSLGPLERFFWRYTERNPTHFLLVAEFDRTLRADHVRKALDAVQRRHPLLSAHVHDDPELGLGFYQADHVAPIDLTVHRGLDWQSIAAEELARRFSRMAAPLMRATLVDHDNSSTLLLTFDHSIADGISSVLVLDDVLAAINGATPPPLALPMSQEDLARRTLDSPPQVEMSMQQGDPRLAVPVSVRPFESTPPHLQSVEMSDDDTTCLIRRCREERATVHGAIVTAASHVRALESGERYVRTYSPINIRELLGQGPDCCLRIGSACTGMAPAEGADFWTQARAVNGQLNFAKSDAGVLMGTELVEQRLPTDAGCDAAERFFCTTLPFELLITNLGVQHLTESGPVRPRAIWGPIVLAQIEREQVIGVITYGGRLRMVCCGHTPTPGFLHNVRERLRDASRC
ncbi:hypothetical protein AWB92_06195 [Mycobacterium sp. IEC1808]|uniref:hypothetical protein n=1 Tax=Mycobacterium sp. IEC1808 TaxID=1743230 RepID=UPI000A147079|nr:hypothetical protein [Mycobacterium sp. IEC1808]ORW96538.1 hypothetical protein AWB92_06195 [Mycobacterium sp. IEC1808]